jgi:hypothetical protein
MKDATRRLGIACLLSSSASSAAAWGPVGHRAIALIAQDRLTPQTRTNLAAVFGHEPSLRDLATCADDIVWAGRDASQPLGPACAEVFPDPPTRTEHWHYVNLSVRVANPSDAQIRAACRGRDCAVAQIPLLATTLANARALKAERARAATFLVHLVGDVHQPLHASDRADHGGNDVEVRLMGRPPKKLHALWDSDVPRLIAPSERGIVASVNAEVLLAERERPQAVSSWVFVWVRESQAAARDVVDKDVAEPPAISRLGRDYAAAARDLARRRIAQAGVRLAAVLNASLP